MPYDEIAEAVGKSPVAVRQIAHRARNHVSSRRPRAAVSRSEQQQVVDLFMKALQGGDLQPLLDVLAPEVVLITDGGGVAAALPAPVEGSTTVAQVLRRLGRFLAEQGTTLRLVPVNGATGIRVDIDGVLAAVINPVVEDGRVTRIYSMRNPEKLGRLDEAIQLSR
jgi:hypothetical protein